MSEGTEHFDTCVPFAEAEGLAARIVPTVTGGQGSNPRGTQYRGAAFSSREAMSKATYLPSQWRRTRIAS